MIKFMLEDTRFYENTRFGFDAKRMVMWEGDWYVAHDSFKRSLETLVPDGLHVEQANLPIWRGDSGKNVDGEDLLVLCWGGLGDLVSMIPLFKYIRENYPFNKICLAVPFISTRWLQYIDHVIEYPAMLRRIEHFENLVMFDDIFEDTMKRELVDVFADIMGLGAMTHEERAPRLIPDPSVVDYMSRVLPPLKPGQKRIGIHIKGSVAERSIPVNKALAMALELGVNRGHQVLLLGHRNDFYAWVKDEEGRKVSQRNIIDNVYSMCGLVNGEEEITAMVSQLDFFIGPDSGLLHIAGAQDIPGLGIFPTYSSSIRLGYYPSIEGVDVDQSLHAEERTTFFPDSVDDYNRAIEAIDFDEVVGRADAYLNDN